MAHELGHVILLGGRQLNPTTPDINPSTGLADRVAVGGPVTTTAFVKSSNGSLKQASANFACTPWATIPLGRCLVDSNNALTGQCAGAQLLNPKSCSVTTDNVACTVGQPSTSTQTRLCSSGATGMFRAQESLMRLNKHHCKM
jgi:hypothetical protein